MLACGIVFLLKAAALADERGDGSGLVIHPVAERSQAPSVFTGDVRTLPLAAPWQPGQPVLERRRRRTHPDASAPAVAGHRDPLLDLQAAVHRLSRRMYSPPELDFDGQGFTGVVPPDTIGEVGSNYYIHAINNSTSSAVTIYSKASGAVIAGPFNLQSLWAAGGQCASGSGDPIVLYDQLASRWLLSEFASSGNHLCVYLSRNNDPVGGGWLNYDFHTPDFPDYPKFGVWPDAYFVTTNEASPTVYALERSQMLAGLPASQQRFTAPSLGGFSFQSLTPADLDGSTLPPATSDAFFIRHKDDEVHPPAVAATDRLEVWQLHVDFATAANSTFSLASSVAVSEFDSDLCGTTSFECIPQPGTSQRLDPLREVVMWRAQYRNFGAYQTLVGNFVTDVSGSDHAGIRWFELRRVGLGAWTLFQEGTYAPDANHRWLGSIAMDGTGNMALGFSISSSAIFPGMRYTGRLATDTLGVMTQPEVTVVSGGDSQSNERWGDYSSMNVDPVNDCTFWYTNEYIPSGGLWKTRITRFRYDAPACIDAVAPLCGNNLKEVGEDCDGTDASFCPGLCTGGCTCPTPVCGNNSLEVGEECDGTSAAACTSGACKTDCTCDLCGPTPATGCFQAGPEASRVGITDDIFDDTRDKLKWTWKKGDASSKTDFGNPVSAPGASYAVCVYDGSANPQPLLNAPIAAGGTCGSAACWREGPTNYKYRNRSGNAAGISKVLLKEGDVGRAQVQIQGKGLNLVPPNPMLTLPVTVQLVANTGAGQNCWQTQYTSFTRNDDERFNAAGP